MTDTTLHDVAVPHPTPAPVHAASLLGLRFPDALEQSFQQDYFGKIVKYLRVISILFFLLNGLGAVRSVQSGESLDYTLVSVALMASNISLLPLTFHKHGWKIWQP